MMAPCKIDHADALAVPAHLCRVCHPLVLEAGAVVAVETVANGKEQPWPYAVRRDNLTPRDLEVMAELSDTRAQTEKAKATARIAKMKRKQEAKAIPEGARWDTRTARWVVPKRTLPLPSGNSHAKATPKKRRRKQTPS